MKTIILDNYDSFTFNLYQYIGELDERPLVFRNDQIRFEELERLHPDRIVHKTHKINFLLCHLCLFVAFPFLRPEIGLGTILLAHDHT